VPWTIRLTRLVKIRGGGALKTLADAGRYVLAIDDGREERNHWQSAARKLMEAAEGGNVEAATIQIELALLKEGRLVP